MGRGARFLSRFVIGAALAGLLLAACGDSPAETTTVPPSTEAPVDESEPTDGATAESTAAPSTAAPTTTTTQAPATTTTAPSGPECLTYWSETLIQDLVGDNWGFSDASLDGTTCTFTAVPSSIGVFFRAGDMAAFEAAKAGAGLTGDLVEFTIETCDGAYFVDLGGIVVAESYSDAQGRIFNATVSGVDDPVSIATSLIQTGCEGPFLD